MTKCEFVAMKKGALLLSFMENGHRHASVAVLAKSVGHLHRMWLLSGRRSPSQRPFSEPRPFEKPVQSPAYTRRPVGQASSSSHRPSSAWPVRRRPAPSPPRPPPGGSDGPSYDPVAGTPATCGG